MMDQIQHSEHPSVLASALGQQRAIINATHALRGLSIEALPIVVSRVLREQRGAGVADRVARQILAEVHK